MSRRLGVLISGRGSNLQSIIDAIQRGELQATIVVVISDRPEAVGLLRAKEAGLETVCLRQRDFDSRDGYDTAVADALCERAVDLVCLAGFMRLVGAPLLDAFPHRILNIHPSLLPAFPGLEAWKQALAYGVKFTGCTVHFVDQGVDTGPIIAQQVVPVLEGDTPAVLHERIQQAERALYPATVQALAEGRIHVHGRQTIAHAHA